ncbi:CNNM domain-containing protein [Bythopirellula polymerisocia]|uniref:Magnesium and cobalt efflux protein CorC n=1 Tax=Bythopirellula polymerisocia TaxID=2528003 RepID=A0A5C6CG60_9BACT|nr:CNNM domain-containing protein [Bythopirellula polymerisocia]TWU23630.1 Magnesium and cobalt efflux protein CorC [Bythopirellula polymerisocia]
MILLQNFGAAFAAMALIVVGSAFFSCSEAALFSLQPEDRRRLKRGTPPQRVAVRLLAHPEKLLMAILFWNLILNIGYFAIASVVSIRLQSERHSAEAGMVAFVALITLIIFGEMVPKTIGVLAPRQVSSIISFPLTLAVRVFSPLAPVFSAINHALRRLLFPNFEKEQYLELADLEQAITISTPDEELAAQERTALQNIVLLSDLTAEELMRPRTLYQKYSPPVQLADLGGEFPLSGYLLVTEPESEEIAGAIALKLLCTIPHHNLEHFAQPVVYVPWSATVASVFDTLNAEDREVAAVINEFGETIGIVTLEDLLHTVFEDDSSRSARMLATASIHPVGDNLWHVTGMTSLRRLSRFFAVTLPKCKSTTVAGVLQEVLQRLPEVGDEVEWPPFRFRVLGTEPNILVELELFQAMEESS